MAKQHYIAEVESTIAGIPCLIGVTSFNRVEPSYSYAASSDFDYYGYTEADWVVLDRKGYKANWLEKKLSRSDIARIDSEISEAL
jgi:hypothetical protein